MCVLFVKSEVSSGAPYHALLLENNIIGFKEEEEENSIKKVSYTVSVFAGEVDSMMRGQEQPLQ